MGIANAERFERIIERVPRNLPEINMTAWLRRAVETNRNHPLAHLNLAAALATLGRMEEAREAAATARSLNPAFTIASVRSSTLSGEPRYLAMICDALRKAGVPEG